MYDELLPNEVILMPKQASPFNGDFNVENEFLKLNLKFNLETVIECGSCVGGSTKWFGNNYKNVYTIEICEDFRNICLKRIDGLNNVTSILGNSIDHLGSILKKCNDNTVIYLDDHWNLFFPLLEELKIILDSGLKPVIVIHDCKVPNEPNLGYDSYSGADISYELIKTSLEDIYGINGYDYYYNSDATATEVKRGLIYITPKK